MHLGGVNGLIVLISVPSAFSLNFHFSLCCSNPLTEGENDRMVKGHSVRERERESEPHNTDSCFLSDYCECSD